MEYLLLAHLLSWYPKSCCDDSHCKPVPCEELDEQKDGTIRYGRTVFRKDMIHPSQDNMCHVCQDQRNNETFPYCVFIQNST